MSSSAWVRACSASRSLPSETVPVDRPSSRRVIGRIRSHENRPAPVCRVASSAGTAEPVRMNGPSCASTALRTWFQIAGTSCHSSMRRGLSPSRTSDGSIVAAVRASWSTSRRTLLFARWLAVSVLPTPLAPSISTATCPCSASSSSASTTRGMYSDLRATSGRLPFARGFATSTVGYRYHSCSVICIKLTRLSAKFRHP